MKRVSNRNEGEGPIPVKESRTIRTDVVLEEFVIPSCSARAFELNEGHRLRVIAHEGKQVADLKFIRLSNTKEQFASHWSILLNTLEGTGTSSHISKLWSGPPYENVLATVVRDDVARHFMNGSCSRRWAELSGGMKEVIKGELTCWDLFDEALSPFGIGADETDSQGTFNVFMSVEYDENGRLMFEAPRCKRDDCIEFEANVDLLVAATSCPDRNEINDFCPKAMKYQILARA